MCNVDGLITVNFPDGTRQVEPDFWMRKEEFLSKESKLVPFIKGWLLDERADGTFNATEIKK